MSSLVDHANRELDIAGFTGSDLDDYNGMIRVAVIDLVKVFAAQGHSGMSASITTRLLNKLLQYDNLTPLTNDPAEWNDVGGPANPMWQSQRCSEAFSRDGGKTYYLLEEHRKMARKIWFMFPQRLRKTKLAEWVWNSSRLMYPIHTAINKSSEANS